MVNICSIEGCDEPVHAVGLCQPHYRQERRRMRGLSLPGPKPDPTRPRSRYRDDQCVLGHLYEEGSYRTELGGRKVCLICRPLKTHCPASHEYTEENTYVDSRGGKHCRACQRGMMRDRRPKSVGQGGHNAAKTHCPRNHEYTPENTIWSKDGRRSCRACARHNGRVQTLRRFHLTVEGYEALLVAQDGKCGICDVLESESLFGVDHDHKCCEGDFSCGKCVRGLLCPPCNFGLSYYEDSPVLMRSGADYLERTTRRS